LFIIVPMFFCENECVVCAKIESAITDFCRLVCFYGGIGGNNKRPKMSPQKFETAPELEERPF
jgi:hypothetical protein